MPLKPEMMVKLNLPSSEHNGRQGYVMEIDKAGAASIYWYKQGDKEPVIELHKDAGLMFKLGELVPDDGD